MSVPHYHDQPSTLDPNVRIPEEPALAQGHDPDKAADVRDAADELRATVEDETEASRQATESGQPEPGAPGDPTVRLDSETGEPIADDSEPVPSGTVDEVLAWVGSDHSRATRALMAEKAGQNRSTLISSLQAI